MRNNFSSTRQRWAHWRRWCIKDAKQKHKGRGDILQKWLWVSTQTEVTQLIYQMRAKHRGDCAYITYFVEHEGRGDFKHLSEMSTMAKVMFRRCQTHLCLPTALWGMSPLHSCYHTVQTFGAKTCQCRARVKVLWLFHATFSMAGAYYYYYLFIFIFL